MTPNPSLYEWLSHPLLLIIVGALISSYLIPALTRRWQDHWKELELKVSLLSRISKSATDMVMAVQYAKLRTKSQTQEDYDRAYRKWEIEAAVIGSHLRAYFPNTQIGPDWDTYSELVTDLYALSGTHDVAKRREQVQKIRDHFSSSPSSVDWDALFEKADPQHWENWSILRQQILNRKDELAQLILKSRMSLFK